MTAIIRTTTTGMTTKDQAWGVYLTENHKKPHEYKASNKKEQSNYWNWRHSHPDKD